MLVHWGEWGDFLLATENLAFSYPDSQYMPQCKLKTTGNYLCQKLLINPGVLASIAEGNLNLTGCLQHINQTWFTIRY